VEIYRTLWQCFVAPGLKCILNCFHFSTNLVPYMFNGLRFLLSCIWPAPLRFVNIKFIAVSVEHLLMLVNFLVQPCVLSTVHERHSILNVIQAHIDISVITHTHTHAQIFKIAQQARLKAFMGYIWHEDCSFLTHVIDH
jgi:hypothetical protein